VGKGSETAMVNDQSHGTHPSLNSPGFAVSFTTLPTSLKLRGPGKLQGLEKFLRAGF